jgi:hypothetical protein
MLDQDWVVWLQERVADRLVGTEVSETQFEPFPFYLINSLAIFVAYRNSL